MAKRIEKKIESDSMLMLEADGWWQRKFTSPSHRGVPDRICAKDKRVLFLEFKDPNGELSALQKVEIALMQAAGLEVHVVDSVEQVREICAIGV